MILEWGDVANDEEVSQQDIKDAESSGRPPVGKYLCTVEETKPKQVNPKDKPSYYVATLIMRIDEAIEINGRAATNEESEAYEGRKIFDDISLKRDDEPDALKNRRILVAKRAGIISDSSSKIPANAWSEQIIGKQFLITYIEETYTPANSKTEKTIRKVAFDGYESPENAVKVSDDELDDI